MMKITPKTTIEEIMKALRRREQGIKDDMTLEIFSDGSAILKRLHEGGGREENLEFMSAIYVEGEPNT